MQLYSCSKVSWTYHPIAAVNLTRLMIDSVFFNCVRQLRNFLSSSWKGSRSITKPIDPSIFSHGVNIKGNLVGSHWSKQGFCDEQWETDVKSVGDYLWIFGLTQVYLTHNDCFAERKEHLTFWSANIQYQFEGDYSMHNFAPNRY